MGCITDPKLAATPLHAQLDCAADIEPMVLRVTETPNLAPAADQALIVRSRNGELAPGYGAYLACDGLASSLPVIALPPELFYLEDGDIIHLNPRQRHIWVMYRRSSHCN